ncbi:hypothetical protein [Endozoicomonas elysicola]|uniref:hypothetical protein n=1 Tax=Endozoicomonas elysicola TaxID=305900 RepID=UPI001268CEB7|nr:hypothetical protein [Endozoicomonas elysicola]
MSYQIHPLLAQDFVRVFLLMDTPLTAPPTTYVSLHITVPQRLHEEVVITQSYFIELATSSNGKYFIKDTHYIVKSDLRLEKQTIVSMPGKLTVKGRFEIRDCQIEEIRSEIAVDGSFFISNCNQLKGIFGKIHTGKAFSIRGLKAIEEIACELKITAQMDALGCEKLRSLAGSDIEVGTILILKFCKVLEELPQKTVIVGVCADLRGCSALEIENKGYTIRQGTGDTYQLSEVPKELKLVRT